MLLPRDISVLAVSFYLPPSQASGVNDKVYLVRLPPIIMIADESCYHLDNDKSSLLGVLGVSVNFIITMASRCN